MEECRTTEVRISDQAVTKLGLEIELITFCCKRTSPNNECDNKKVWHTGGYFDVPRLDQDFGLSIGDCGTKQVANSRPTLRRIHRERTWNGALLWRTKRSRTESEILSRHIEMASSVSAF
mmetsp:Transcript_41511/g.61451  ORF Transcript_41511/g.61451 Transcript_41511/m.61451 type:complete len:120 (-) Transcript_41511:245-604(-)